MTAGEQHSQRGGKAVEPVLDVLTNDEPTIAKPATQCLLGFGEATTKVGYGKALHTRVALGQLQVVARPAHLLHLPVLRHRTADDNSRALGNLLEHCIENVATNIVEHHVDTIGGYLAQACADVFVFVIDGEVEAKLVDQKSRFVDATRDADDRGCAGDARQLTSH